MKLASRMDRLGTETAFEVLAKARALEAQGRNIVHLEIGEPDFDTPAPIREAAKRALDEGFTHYGPSPGLPQVRERIAMAQSLRNGYEVSPSQVVVTPGGKPIMFFSIMALVEEGDEVIYPNPGFPIYESMIKFVGGTPVPVQLHEESGYNLDFQELRQAASPKTRLIIVNSPNNPCGSVVPTADLEAIAEVANEVDAIVLSDEIYHDFYYEGSHESITRYPGMSERTIILDGFLQELRDDGLEAGLRCVPRAAGGTDLAAGDQQCLMHLRFQSDSGAGRPGRRGWLCEGDGGRVPAPPGYHCAGSQCHSRDYVSDTEGRLLHLSEHPRYGDDESRVRRWGAQ